MRVLDAIFEDYHLVEEEVVGQVQDGALCEEGETALMERCSDFFQLPLLPEPQTLRLGDQTKGEGASWWG